MRNLKKVLALTLVLALSLSMVISAGAAKFPDVPDTDANAAAYSLLADLQIAQGYDDGTFQPDTNLTRETAVTFIFRMATGQANADYMKGNTKFKDVAADRWSAGYINWASEKNIVQGDPDGTFAPARTVSVAELSKMLVVAMGYDVKNYNFPWGFVDKAQDLGLLNGLLNQSANTPATRGMTSVVIKNALLNDGRVEIIGDNVNKLKSFAESRFNIKKNDSNRLIGTSNLVGNSTISALNQIELAEGTGAGKYTFEGNVDSLFGRKVTVWYKDADGDGVLDAGETVVSVIAKGGDKVLSASGIAAAGTAKIDGTTYTFPTNVNSVDFGAAGTVTYVQYNNTTVYGVSDANNGTLNYVWTTTPNVNKVSNITAAGIMTTAGVEGDAAVLASVAKEQIKAYDGIAKNDYVYVSPAKSVYKNASGNVTLGTVYTLTKANTVSSVQLTSRASDNITYTFGGNTYKLSSTTPAITTLGATYDLILSPTGFVKFADEVTSAKTVVYGVLTNTNNGTFGVGGYTGRTLVAKLGDGTSASYQLVDTLKGGAFLNDTAWKDASVIIPTAVKLTLNADNKVTAIEAISSVSGVVSGQLIYTKSTGIATIGTVNASNTYTINDDTVVFYVTGSTVNVYKGSAIPAITAGNAVNVDAGIVSTSGVRAVAALVVNKPLASVATTTGYIQYTGASLTSDNATVHNYKVAYTDGSIKDITSTVPAVINGNPATVVGETPSYGTITITNGVVTLTSSTIANQAKAVTAKSGNVVVAGGTLYTVKSDAKIVVIETTTAGAYKSIKDVGSLDDVVVDSVIDFLATGSEITFIAVYSGSDAASVANANITSAIDALTTPVSVIQGTDSDLLTKLGTAAIEGANGVTVTLTASSNPAVIAVTSGTITYPNAAAATVNVTFTVAKANGATQTKVITVNVPQSTDGQAVATAKAAIQALNPSGATHNIANTVASMSVDLASIISADGVTLTYTASTAAAVAAGATDTVGAITPQVAASQGIVSITITKGTATDTVTLNVTVAAA